MLNKSGRQSSTKDACEKSSCWRMWRKSWSNWLMTGSHLSSCAVARELIQQWSVHGTPIFLKSRVMSMCPFSALWYMASCSTFTWVLDRIFGSSTDLPFITWPGSRSFLLPGGCAPSARISSSDKTSFDDGWLNGCANSLWRIDLWPCDAATDIALKLPLKKQIE